MMPHLYEARLLMGFFVLLVMETSTDLEIEHRGHFKYAMLRSKRSSCISAGVPQ